MEAIVFEFKDLSKINVEQNRNQQTTSNKDFSSTLEKVNNLKEKAYTEKKDNKTTTTKDDTEMPEVIDVKEEKNPDYSVVYGIPLLLNEQILSVNTNEMLDENIELEIEVEALTNIPMDIEVDMVVDKDVEVEEPIDLESNNFDIRPKEDLDIKNTKVETTSLDYKPSEILDKSEESKIVNHEIKAEVEQSSNKNVESDKDDVALGMGQNIIPEETNEEIGTNLEQRNKQNLTSNKESNRDVQSKEVEKDTKTSFEPFISVNRNEVRFADKITTELEDVDTLKEAEVVEQIVEKVKFNMTDTKNEIKIRLKPEVLGEMTMNIEVAKGAVIAKIMVDNHRTKEIIEGNLFQLKEGIKDTGLEIKAFEVFVGNNSDFDKHNQKEFNFNQNNKKIKIKSQEGKISAGYEEQTVDNKRDINDLSNGGLNLFA